MATNGKEFKLFIGGEEIAQGTAVDTTDIFHDMESAKCGGKMSFSADCSIDTSTFEGLYRAILMQEIKDLTYDYNRIMRIKNK